MKTITPAEHVQTVQAGDSEIAGEISVVRRHEHCRALDICLFDLRDLFRRRNVKKMRTIHCPIRRIGVHRIERDFIFLDVRIVERLVIMQMTCDLDPRRQSFRQQMIVAEIRLIFLQRARS